MKYLVTEDEYKSALVNADGDLTFTRDNGEVIVVGRVKGEPGEQGVPGPNTVPTYEAIGQALSEDGPVKDQLNATIAEMAGAPLVIDAPWSPDVAFQPENPQGSALAVWGSSTMQGIASHLAPLAAQHGMSYFDGGKGSERIEHTSARQGALPATVTFPGGVVPASGATTVTVEQFQPFSDALKSYTGYVTTPAGPRIEGELRPLASSYEWVRTTAGDAATLAGPVDFIPTEGQVHRNDLMIINAGKNSLMAVTPALHDPVMVAEKTMRMVGHQAALRKRVLVLGQFVNRDEPAVSAARDRIYRADAILSRNLGPTFFNTHEWITSSEVWTETGITPTQDDLDAQAIGNKPPSLSADNGHLNAAGYSAYAARILARLVDLGWAEEAPTTTVTSDSFSGADGAIDGTLTDAAFGGVPMTWSSTGYERSGGKLVTPASNATAQFTQPDSNLHVQVKQETLPAADIYIDLFRTGVTSSGTLYRVSLSNQGRPRFTKYVEGAASQIIPSDPARTIVSGDWWGGFVDKDAGEVHITINGAIVATVADSTITSGDVYGLATTTSAAGAIISGFKASTTL